MEETKEENINAERKSLMTKVSEVTKEKDEALSKLKSSERIIYTLSFFILIVAVGFTVALSTRQAKCHDNFLTTKEAVETVQNNYERCLAEFAGCNNILFEFEGELNTAQKATEQIMADLLKCDSSVDNMKQELKSSLDEIHQCNNTLTITQTILEECRGKTCIKEDEYQQINDKLEKSTMALNECKTKVNKVMNIDKKQNKNDKKLKKCQSCVQDLNNINMKGVHILKNRVLQVIPVERQWKTARKDCQERGGDLVVPKNSDKLAEYLLEKEPEFTNYWVGISDLETAEEFRGVNGGQVVGGWETQHQVHRMQNPEKKTPGNDCVRLTYTDPFSKGLVATTCDAGLYYICDMGEDSKHDIYN